MAKDALESGRAFRAKDDQTPLVLMGYFNPIYTYGECDKPSSPTPRGRRRRRADHRRPAAGGGRTSSETGAGGQAAGMRLHPARDADHRRFTACRISGRQLRSGFVYYVSILGITGTKSAPTRADRRRRWRGYRKAHRSSGRRRLRRSLRRSGRGEIGRVRRRVVVGSALVEQGLDARSTKTARRSQAPGRSMRGLRLVAELAGGVRVGRG